jgi:ankyrin repeat protein
MSVAGVTFTPWILFAERALTPAENVARFKRDQLPFLTNVLHITAPAWVMNQTEASFSPLDELTKLMLEKGALIDQEQPAFGGALFIAAKRGKIDIVKALIEAKANLELRAFVSGPYAGHMLTPIMIAALNGHTAVVELLAQAGANVNAKSVQRTSGVTSSSSTGYTMTTTWTTNTALSLASEAKHPDTVAMLMKYGGKGPKE